MKFKLVGMFKEDGTKTYDSWCVSNYEIVISDTKTEANHAYVLDSYRLSERTPQPMAENRV